MPRPQKDEPLLLLPPEPDADKLPRYAERRQLVLLCHKLLARFDSRLSRIEILILGGGLWVSNPTDAAANHGS